MPTDLKLRLATWLKCGWVLRPCDHDWVRFIIVAEKWKISASLGLSEPRIAFRQMQHLMVVGDGPFQAHVGERAFHSTNDGHRAAIVLLELWREDGNANVVKYCR